MKRVIWRKHDDQREEDRTFSNNEKRIELSRTNSNNEKRIEQTRTTRRGSNKLEQREEDLQMESTWCAENFSERNEEAI
jgi:hypothetical protein